MPKMSRRSSRLKQEHDPLRRSPRQNRPKPSPTIISDRELPGLAEMDMDTTCEPTDEGVDAEIHIYESRIDSRGLERVLRVGSQAKDDCEPIEDPSRRAAFVLTREYRADRSLHNTTLHIKSPHMNRALRDVIEVYPGVDLNNPTLTQLSEPPMCLYHFRSELWKYAIASRSPVLRSHMDLCLRYMRKALKTELRQYGDALDSKDPALEHRHLWMMFKPGELVYTENDGAECLFRLVSMQPVWKNGIALFKEVDYWQLVLASIQHYQSGPGATFTSSEVPFFEGCKSIRELDVFPLRFHHDKTRIRRDLLNRGRRFLSMVGVQHLWYNGRAHFWPWPTVDGPLDTYANVKHRIIIDHDEFEAQVGRSPSGRKGPTVPGSLLATQDTRVMQKKLGDKCEEIMLTCGYKVPGFSLAWKRWGMFHIDNISDFTFNAEAFGELLLAPRKKDMIRALIEEAQSPGDVFDDRIEGKGRGLVLLFYGPPGVGKTYTAESIADYTRRPLLTIGSGQLTDHSSIVEEELSRYFRVAAKWKAILLIDEADVFLEARSSSDLPRNRVVSSFLRLLEYFVGTLILTTNRAATIDTAFHSRIHLSVAYPSFSSESLKSFWKSWITRACDDDLPAWATDQYLEDLSQIPMSGRDVKNILRVAGALAKNKNRPLGDLDIQQGVESKQDFQAQFLPKADLSGASRD